MNIFRNIKKSKFLLDFSSMLVSKMSLLGVGVLSSIILTRVLGPSGMGLYASLTAFSLLFVSLAEMGIRQSTIYFAGKKRYGLEEILSANTVIWLFSSIIGMAIFFYIFKTNDVQVSGPLLWLASLIIPATIANSFINGVMLGADRITKSAGLNTINGVFRLGAIFLFVWWMNFSVLGAVLASLIPTTTLIFRKYFYLRKKDELKFKLAVNRKIIKNLISNGLLYGIALFLMSNQKQIPVLVMTGRVAESEIGIYSAGYTFASLLYNVYSSLAPIIFVKSSKALDPLANSLKIQKLMRVVFVILIVLCGFLYFALNFIIPLMYGSAFIESIPVTRILFIGIIFYNIFLILNMDMAGRGKPWIAIYALIPVTILNFCANYYFIGAYGNIGAALSTSVSMAIGSLLYLSFYAKELQMSVLNIISPRRSDWDFISQLRSKN